MVAKKKKVPTTIPDVERLQLQLLNSYVDRAKEAYDKYTVMLENAKLGQAMAQRDVAHAKAELEAFGKTLAEKYQFSLITDSVNWETGEIQRNVGEPDE